MFIPSIQSYTLQQTNANMVGEKMKVYPLSMKTPKDFHSYASLLEGTYIYTLWLFKSLLWKTAISIG
jgi:hypothetical protein